jgi:hypothetical protein
MGHVDLNLFIAVRLLENATGHAQKIRHLPYRQP